MAARKAQRLLTMMRTAAQIPTDLTMIVHYHFKNRFMIDVPGYPANTLSSSSTAREGIEILAGTRQRVQYNGLVNNWDGQNATWHKALAKLPDPKLFVRQ